MTSFTVPSNQSNCVSSCPVEREKKVKEEQRYEKSVEVDQKTKQIGLERNAVELILNETLPAAMEEARISLAAITLADCEAEIINNASVPEVLQVRTVKRRNYGRIFEPFSISGQVIVECVLVLRGDSPSDTTSWEYAKATMATENLEFFAELQRINLEAITSKQLSTIKAALKVRSCSSETRLIHETNCLTAIKFTTYSSQSLPILQRCGSTVYLVMRE